MYEAVYGTLSIGEFKLIDNIISDYIKRLPVKYPVNGEHQYLGTGHYRSSHYNQLFVLKLCQINQLIWGTDKGW
jgi:hypothetical protein